MTTAAPTASHGASETSAARIPSEVFVEVVRLCIVAMATAVGYAVAGGRSAETSTVGDHAILIGTLLGASLGYVIGGVVGRMLRVAMGTFEERIERAPAPALFAGTLGALFLGGLGVVLGIVVTLLLPGRWGWPILGLMAWIGLYAGFQAGARKGEELLGLLRHGPGVAIAPVTLAPTEPVTSAGPVVVVDSSAAIDGRLGALAASGFLPGTLAVPRFVLDELQGIADASDPGRRRRGQRALEELDHLRADHGLVVLPDEVPERDEVDAKLVVLTQRLGGVLLTVDHNLAQVAEIQGVGCLNVHRLASSLQPVLVPGETLRLTVSRRGRDAGQGVGFLDDGTMVIVSETAELVGSAVDVRITSSVQTSKGRMFFASLAS